MNASVKALAVKLFNVAEHEVDDLCKGLVSMFEHGGGQAAPAAAGPTQEEFDALKEEVASLQQTIDDLTKPDPSTGTDASSASTGTLGDASGAGARS